MKHFLKRLALYLAVIVGAYGAGNDAPDLVVIGGAMWLSVWYW